MAEPVQAAIKTAKTENAFVRTQVCGRREMEKARIQGQLQEAARKMANVTNEKKSPAPE